MEGRDQGLAAAEAQEKKEAKQRDARVAAVVSIFRRYDGELYPDPDNYEKALLIDYETNPSRVFWMPDDEEFEETGKWTSRAIIDGEPSIISMTMDPDQELSEGATVELHVGEATRKLDILEALDWLSEEYPQTFSEIAE